MTTQKFENLVASTIDADEGRASHTPETQRIVDHVDRGYIHSPDECATCRIMKSSGFDKPNY